MAQRPGYNTVHGFDTGPPPPGFTPNQPPGVAQYPGFFAPAPPVQAPVYPTFPSAVYAPPQPQLLMASAQAPPPAYSGFYPNPAMTYPTNAPNSSTSSVPGIHFTNPTGGIGLPPGYDYLFPAEHCTVHAITTGKDKPWQIQIPMGTALPHLKLFVPTNTSVKEMMRRLGCTNDDPKKNVLYEVTEKGNGHWAKGITISGDEKDKVKKSISDFGWDKSRTGFPGQRPVVWLYLTKD